MQRHLPKIVLAAAFFSIIYLNPESINALTEFRSSVKLKQNSNINSESIKQSTRIQINNNDKEIVVISITPAPSPTPKNITPSSDSSTPPNIVQKIQSASPSSTPVPSKSLPPFTPKPSNTPAKIPTSQAFFTDTKEFIMKAINDYRKLKGLSPVQTSSETCDFAKTRAREISASFNHDGFRNRINNKVIPYKNWSLITENLAMTSNYKNVVNIWIASSGHEQNLRKNTPYVCVESFGNYYAYEGMKP